VNQQLSKVSHPGRAVFFRIIQTEWGSTSGAIDIAVRDRQAIYQDDVIITATPVSYTVSTSRAFGTDGN